MGADRLLARAPRRARRLASELDLARSVGVAAVWRRRRHEARLEQVGRGFLDAVYGRIWREAAAEVGARVSEAGDGFLEIERGGARTRVRHHVVPLDDPATLRRALDKKAVHDALTGAGVPVPEHLEFALGGLAPARRFVEASRSPCVVKPSSGTAGGAGVTSGVRTWPELRRAVLRASGYDTRMLVEAQGSGHVYRLLVLDGVLLDVVRRQPCGVTGDGRSTVGELIEQENRRRLTTPEAVPILPVDLDCVFTLGRAGLDLRSVLPAGRRAVVKTVTSQNRPDENETFRDGLSERLVATALDAVRSVGVTLGGVDLVTAEPSLPLEEAGGVVIEVNGTPALHYHYQVADRAGATRVAVPVLERLLKE